MEVDWKGNFCGQYPVKLTLPGQDPVLGKHPEMQLQNGLLARGGSTAEDS